MRILHVLHKAGPLALAGWLALSLMPESMAAEQGALPVSIGSYQEAEEQIAQQLRAAGAGADVQADIFGAAPAHLFHPANTVTLAALDWDARAETFEGVIEVSRPDGYQGRMNIRGRYDEMVNVPVVAERLHEGSVIREHDLEWESMPAARVREDVVTDPRRLIGKMVRRTIGTGRPIRSREVSAPFVVEENMQVSMVYRTPYMEIRTVGQTLDNGAAGDSIRVRNQDSGKLVQAQVEPDGSVSVLSIHRSN